MKARWMSKIDNKKYEAGIISKRYGHEVETFIVYSQGFFSMSKKIPVNTCDINNYEKENKEQKEYCYIALFVMESAAVYGVAEEGKQLPFFDGEGKVADGDHVPVSLGEALRLHGLHRASPFRLVWVYYNRSFWGNARFCPFGRFRRLFGGGMQNGDARKSRASPFERWEIKRGIRP